MFPKANEADLSKKRATRFVTGCSGASLDTEGEPPINAPALREEVPLHAGQHIRSQRRALCTLHGSTLQAQTWRCPGCFPSRRLCRRLGRPPQCCLHLPHCPLELSQRRRKPKAAERQWWRQCPVKGLEVWFLRARLRGNLPPGAHWRWNRMGEKSKIENCLCCCKARPKTRHLRRDLEPSGEAGGSGGVGATTSSSRLHEGSHWRTREREVHDERLAGAL